MCVNSSMNEHIRLEAVKGLVEIRFESERIAFTENPKGLPTLRVFTVTVRNGQMGLPISPATDVSTRNVEKFVPPTKAINS